MYVDITAPLYWWKEFDTYKVGTVANSCSTMHKIAGKEFTLEDFSCEHLFDWEPDEHGEPRDTADTEEELIKQGAVFTHEEYDPYSTSGEDNGIWYEGDIAADALRNTVAILNAYREKYLETKDKKYWWQMIQLLPSSYNQKRTVMMNYEVIAAIVEQRKGHKLDEWHDFIEWAHKLPLAKEIIFCEDGDSHDD